jgi:mono/diheme cytochrome c family protein
MKTWLLWIVSAAAGVALLVLAVYAFILPGLSSARQEPSGAETDIATWLLHHSVPGTAKAALNPLGTHPDPAAITEGRDLFRQKCEACHAYDGGGKTELGSGEFPRPPVLRDIAPSMSDGEIFYHIRNGIRNTAMPAWSFPDAQVWQL